ncbi:M23 family metallopeptidase [Micromonospora sp. NBC_00362]|uniref:M23 family metallopeptidase n=1 Tax=Micromonospora sp. NBC_00362 TaxID=2975975 RepID=UPI002B1DB71F|nr:M23 family metallopeptidase [Micromonospora sp. NBC_00362]
MGLTAGTTFVFTLVAALTSVAPVSAGVADFSATVAGARPDFRAPWTCGQQRDYFHHSNEVPNAIDFNLAGTADLDTPALASAAGTVVAAGLNGGYGNEVVVDHGSGWRSRVAHLNAISVRVGETVDRGQLIGRVGSTGNSSGPHLHYEQLADGVRVPIVVDSTAMKYDGATYRHTSVNCAAASVNARVGVVKGGELYVKEGNLFADWVWQAAGVKDFSLAGDRIGVVLTDGRVQVKEGNLWSGWDSVASGGQSVELDGDRVGVLHTNGTVNVKEGPLNAGWATQSAGVKDLSLAGDRIGVVLTDGRVQVKEGNLWSGWDSVASGGQSVELDGDRVGVLHTNGTVNVKEGPLNAGWATQSAGVKDLSLAGDRIGVVLTDGRVQVKEGNLWSGWDSVASGGQSVELDGDRVGVLHTNGTVNVKEGPLNAGWATQAAGVTDLELS